MQSSSSKRLPILLLALVLSAMATPTLAVVDITFCDEITHPGLYRVTQDLSCRSRRQCLLIDASNVTIDLQGHSITGDGATTGTGIAVPRNSSLSNIEVRNGTVSSFVVGINLEGAKKARVEHMRVFENKTMGILTGGSQRWCRTWLRETAVLALWWGSTSPVAGLWSLTMSPRRMAGPASSWMRAAWSVTTLSASMD